MGITLDFFKSIMIAMHKRGTKRPNNSYVFASRMARWGKQSRAEIMAPIKKARRNFPC